MSPASPPLASSTGTSPRSPPPGEPWSSDVASTAGSTGRWLLRVGVLAAAGWITLVPLDEGVPAIGTVVVDTQRKPIQHQAGGMVHAVFVREGQAVEAGQLLMQLETAPASANREAVRQRYQALRALESRLRAEQSGATRISWHPSLLAADASAEAQSHMLAQQDLLVARRQALAAELLAIDAGLQAQRGLLLTAQKVAVSREQQMELVRQALAQMRELVAEGFAPRNRQHDLERQEAEIEAVMTELLGQQAQAISAIAELNQRAAQRRSEERRDSSQQLAEVLRDVQAEGERLRAVQVELERTELRAPVAGQVVGLAVQTPGSVVEPAHTLMSIVPDDELLVIDTQVPPNFIDRVQSGQAVDARFQSFAHTPQLVVQARVQSVSADRLLDPVTQVPYYLARVVITPEGHALLGQRQLQPGMPAEVIFKTGERSLLTYWMAPLTRRLAWAVTED